MIAALAGLLIGVAGAVALNGRIAVALAGARLHRSAPQHAVAAPDLHRLRAAELRLEAAGVRSRRRRAVALFRLLGRDHPCWSTSCRRTGQCLGLSGWQVFRHIRRRCATPTAATSFVLLLLGTSLAQVAASCFMSRASSRSCTSFEVYAVICVVYFAMAHVVQGVSRSRRPSAGRGAEGAMRSFTLIPLSRCSRRCARRALALAFGAPLALAFATGRISRFAGLRWTMAVHPEIVQSVRRSGCCSSSISACRCSWASRRRRHRRLHALHRRLSGEIWRGGLGSREAGAMGGRRLSRPLRLAAMSARRQVRLSLPPAVQLIKGTSLASIPLRRACPRRASGERGDVPAATHTRWVAAIYRAVPAAHALVPLSGGRLDGSR